MKYSLIIIMLAVLFYSCDDDNVSVPDKNDNLITNPSFENNGNPTLIGWNTSGIINFYEDIPAGGGIYSIGIDEAWGPANYVSFTIAAEEGRNIYSFTCWSKTERFPSEVSMQLTRDTVIQTSFITINDSSWKSYNLTDTITAASGDSLKIILYGCISQILPSKTYYDNCFLEKK